MAVVTRSIGITGRDYSTIISWEADLDNAGVYNASDDAVGECYNDSNFTPASTISINGGGTVGLATITLSVASTERHDGTAGSGARIVTAGNDRNLSGGNSNVPVRIEWLEVDVAGFDSDNPIVFNGNNQDSSTFRGVFNCIVHGSDTVGGTGAGITIAQDDANVANCIVYDIDFDTGSGEVYGIEFTGGSNYIGSAFNCTVHNIQQTRVAGTGDCHGIYVTQTSGLKPEVITNCVSCGNANLGSGAAIDFTDGNATVSYNASSDSTAVGTGSITSITVANQFVSTTSGSEDYHIQDSAADIFEAGTDLGTTPTDVNLDIDGDDRDAQGITWSIGADESWHTITKTIGTTGRDYSTIESWEADLDLQTVYGSNYYANGEMYADTTFNPGGTILINGGGTVGLASRTLAPATGQEHDGTANTGVRVLMDAANEDMDVDIGPTTIKLLEYDGGGFNGNDRGLIGLHSATSASIERCLIHDTAGFRTNFIEVGGDGNVHAVVNNICYDMDSQRNDAGGITLNRGGSGNPSTNIYCANNTIHDIVDTDGSYPSRGITASNECYARNNVVTGAETALYISGGTPNLQYTATDLASCQGSNNVLNIVTADQYVSTTGGSEDLHIQDSSADIFQAGTDLGTTNVANVDVDGHDRDTSGITWSIGADESWHTVTKSIGSVGRDYSTVTLWEADLDDSTLYDGTFTARGECYADSDFSQGAWYFNGGGVIGLYEAELTVAAGERHDGTANTGVRFLKTGTSIWCNITSQDTVRRKVRWIELDVNGQRTGNGLFELAGYTTADDDSYRELSNLIVHDGNSSSSDAASRGRIVHHTYDGEVYIHNIIAYDFLRNFAGEHAAFTLAAVVSSQTVKMHNITLHNVHNSAASGDATGFLCEKAVTALSNCVATGMSPGSGGTGTCFKSTKTNHSYNASDDATATGTGSITSIDAADQYVSTSGGSEDLHVQDSAADIFEAGTDLGTTPTDVNLDIDGDDRDASAITWSIGADESWHTITKSIGTTGRDYSTITAWEADLDLQTVYGSNYLAVGECYNDTSFSISGTVGINGGATVGLSSITLTAATGQEHDGTEGTGVQIIPSASNASLSVTGDRDTNISKIEFNGNGQTSSRCRCIVNGSATTEINASRLLVHNVRSTNASVPSALELGNSSGSTVHNANNCIIYDFDLDDGGGSTGYGISLAGGGITHNVSNCTVDNIRRSRGSGNSNGYDCEDASWTFQNCVATQVIGEDGFAGSTSCFSNTLGTQSYNAADDTTASGTGSLDSITRANQYVSTTGGSEDYHIQDSAADIFQAGTDLGATPTGVNLDIDGDDRDTSGITWSIGADESWHTITKSIGTTGRDYSTITLWEADLDLQTVYGSNYTALGECYADTAFSGTINVNGGASVGLYAATLSVAAGERHDGTGGTGVRWVGTSTQCQISADLGVRVTYEWLDMDWNSGSTNGGYGIRLTGSGSINNDASSTRALRNLLLRNSSTNSGNDRGVVSHAYDGPVNITNCMVFDHEQKTSIAGYNWSGIYVCSNAQNTQTVQVLGCTVHDIRSINNTGAVYGVRSQSGTGTQILKNTVVTDTSSTLGGSTSDITGGFDTKVTNATSDTTGNVQNIASADNYVSSTRGSEDLHIKDVNADIYQAGTDLGTAPANVNFDINGIDRDATGVTWSIGAAEGNITFWWVNDAADNNWSNYLNWSLSEGGIGGEITRGPGATDNAYFSATSSPDNCTLSAATDVLSIVFDASVHGGTDNYTGTLDAATFTVTVGIGGVQATSCSFATIDMGTGTWTVDGDWKCFGLGTLTVATASLVLTGTGNYSGTSGASWNDVTITGTYTTDSNSDTFLANDGRTLTVSGTWTITGNKLVRIGGIGASPSVASYLDLNTGGTIALNNASAQLQFGPRSEFRTYDGTLSTTTTGSITLFCSSTYSPVLASGTYTVRVLVDDVSASDSFVFSAGSYVFSGDFVTNDGQDEIDCATNNPTLTFQGDVTVNATTTWTKGTGTITLNGTANQSIDFNGEAVEDIVENKSAGSVTLSGDVTTDSYTLTDGTLDINGSNLTTVGDFTVAAGNTVQDTLTTGSITVGGNFALNGASGNEIIWTDADLTVTGTAVAIYTQASNSDASGGTQITANDGSNTDNGGNVNWLFLLAPTQFDLIRTDLFINQDLPNEDLNLNTQYSLDVLL